MVVTKEARCTRNKGFNKKGHINVNVKPEVLFNNEICYRNYSECLPVT